MLKQLCALLVNTLFNVTGDNLPLFQYILCRFIYLTLLIQHLAKCLM